MAVQGAPKKFKIVGNVNLTQSGKSAALIWEWEKL